MRNGTGRTKEADLVTVAELSPAAKQYYDEGHDVTRLPGSSNVAVRQTPEESKNQYTVQVASWCMQMLFSKRVRRGILKTVKNRESPEVQPLSTHAQAHYDAYSSLILQTPEGTLIAPEEKNPPKSYIRSEEGDFWNFRKELDA